MENTVFSLSKWGWRWVALWVALVIAASAVDRITHIEAAQGAIASEGSE